VGADAGARPALTMREISEAASWASRARLEWREGSWLRKKKRGAHKRCSPGAQLETVGKNGASPRLGDPAPAAGALSETRANRRVRRGGVGGGGSGALGAWTRNLARAAAALAPPLGERERSRRPLGSGAKAFLTPPQVYQGMPQVRTGVGGGGEGAGVACRAGRQSPQCSGRPWGNAVVRSALLVSLTSQPMAGGAGRPDTPTGARPVGTGRAARARRASS